MNGIEQSKNHVASLLFLFLTFLFCWTMTGLARADSIQDEDNLTYQDNHLNLASNDAFIFSPRNHTWKAVSNGKVIRSGRASGGKAYCADTGRACRTPTGTYYISSKRGADCTSSLYPVGKGGARMPYCMFFSRYYAIHGYHDVPNYNASHGCIRVRTNDALWLHHNFMKIGTRVVIQPY